MSIGNYDPTRKHLNFEIDQSVIVRTHDHAFQPHAVQPDGGVFQSPFSCKISRKLLDEGLAENLFNNIFRINAQLLITK